MKRLSALTLVAGVACALALFLPGEANATNCIWCDASGGVRCNVRMEGVGFCIYGGNRLQCCDEGDGSCSDSGECRIGRAGAERPRGSDPVGDSQDAGKDPVGGVGEPGLGSPAPRGKRPKALRVAGPLVCTLKGGAATPFDSGIAVVRR